MCSLTVQQLDLWRHSNLDQRTHLRELLKLNNASKHARRQVQIILGKDRGGQE